jgi:hypothetical protein
MQVNEAGKLPAAVPAFTVDLLAQFHRALDRRTGALCETLSSAQYKDQVRCEYRQRERSSDDTRVIESEELWQFFDLSQ